VPSVAPVAVEPRKINPPGTEISEPSNQVAEKVAAVESPRPNVADGADAEQPGGSSPLIPILAGVVGLVVLALLVKVLKAK